MFDALKGMAGLGSLMKDLPRLKENLEKAKAELAEMTVEAEVGGGAVVAVADGSMRTCGALPSWRQLQTCTNGALKFCFILGRERSVVTLCQCSQPF